MDRSDDAVPASPACVQALARTHTEQAIRTLTEIMRRSKNPNARVRAAQCILERGWGRVGAAAEDAPAESAPVLVSIKGGA